MHKEYDIGIIGGGLAGASLACCLAGQALRVAVFEAFPAGSDQPSYDDRGLALSLSSRRILDAINIWPRLTGKAVPVQHIHVSDRGRFGFVRLHAADLNLAEMGYVVTARELGQALLEKISSTDNIDYICPARVRDVHADYESVSVELEGGTESGTVSCRLLVAADGTNSLAREKMGIQSDIREYGQTAIVTNITASGNHSHTAYERFTSEGPLALLPMPEGRWVSIFTVASEDRDHYLQLDDGSYLAVLQAVFGNRLGKFLKAGTRKSYPLRLVRAARQYQGRMVLLGNAAQTVHPNGAQGFNLGLRDAAALAEHITGSVRHNQDPGAERMLREYSKTRSEDQARVTGFTDAVARLFYNDNPLKAVCRNAGMLLLDLSPSLKKTFIQAGMGVYGRQPDLVRGLRLDQI
ncbi:MAG: 2-octaprenyl-6-methoxyphenyl hydroxylase [Gammaproteobacteria bacterium]